VNIEKINSIIQRIAIMFGFTVPLIWKKRRKTLLLSLCIGLLGKKKIYANVSKLYLKQTRINSLLKN